MAAQTTNIGEALRRSLAVPVLQRREIVDLTGPHAKCIRVLAEIVGMPGITTTRVIAARRTMAELVQAAGIERGWP